MDSVSWFLFGWLLTWEVFGFSFCGEKNRIKCVVRVQARFLHWRCNAKVQDSAFSVVLAQGPFSQAFQNCTFVWALKICLHRWKKWDWKLLELISLWFWRTDGLSSMENLISKGSCTSFLPNRSTNAFYYCDLGTPIKTNFHGPKELYVRCSPVKELARIPYFSPSSSWRVILRWQDFKSY